MIRNQARRTGNVAIVLITLTLSFQPIFAQLAIDNELLAWCIVPFDVKERTPSQRIAMLQDLGFNKYAYDWREKHLDEMANEWRLAKDQGIEVSAVWMWLDDRTDQVGQLSKGNDVVLKAIQSSNLQTQIWLGINANYFENLTDDQSLAKAVKIVDYLTDRLKPLQCNLALYNHGGWFGQPANQIKIIDALPDKEIGIVYNFHHAHEHLDDFDGLVDMMLPHLWTVNLNGMRREGPKILPLGSGDLEKNMIAVLLKKGYKGPLGILGHVDDADVKIILSNNLQGLRSLK